MSVTEIKDNDDNVDKVTEEEVPNAVDVQMTDSKTDETVDIKESTETVTVTATATTTTSSTTTTSISRKPSVEVTPPSRRSLRNVNKRKYEEMADKVTETQSAAKSLKMSSNYSDDDIQVIELDGSKAPAASKFNVEKML